jgi:hypothetical protein
MSQILKEKLILIILLLGFMFFFYGKVIIAPNSYLFSADGDGMKNYYTYAYFIKNNTSNIEHEGMNYPYGEHFMYTDCHPLQASLIKQLTKLFPSLADYSVGILNTFLMLSFLLTAYILFLIFKALNINRYLSIVGAIGITLMSPQIYRLLGHLALSYSFVIPVTIYLLLLFYKKQNLKYIVYLTLFILFSFFTHAYLGMIAALLVIIYASVVLLSKSAHKQNVKSAIFLLCSAVLPMVIFYFFVKWTDTHLNRTTNPWGIYENHANFSTVFLPNNGWLNQWLEPLTIQLKRPWEGWAYIGLIGIFGLIYYIVIVFKKRLPKDQFVLCINHLLVSALFILFFSMLFPFEAIWTYIIEHFTIVKQFRAIGRFAWVFYFVSNILAIYLLNYYLYHFKHKSNPKLVYVLTILLFVFYVLEGVGYHNKVSKEIVKSSNLLDLKQTGSSFQNHIKQLKSEQYQGLISLPFFYIGSDNYSKVSTDEAAKNAFLYSYHLNLPMVNAFLTRTSICESKNIMQLLGKGFYPKHIKNDLKCNLPFLIISTRKDLTESDNDLIEKAEIIIDDKDIQFLKITPEQLFKNTAENEIQKFEQMKGQLYTKSDFLVNDTNLFFQYNTFDTLPNKEYKGAQKNYNMLYEVEGSKLVDTASYLTRFWININGENCGQDAFGGMVFFVETIGDKSEWIFPIYNANSSHQITDNWLLVEIPLNNIKKEATYQLMIKGSELSNKVYKIDNLLFFDEKAKIYKQMPDYLFKNNHQIKAFK